MFYFNRIKLDLEFHLILVTKILHVKAYEDFDLIRINLNLKKI